MIVFDEQGQYTDTFNAYLDASLSPTIRGLAAEIVAWLDENKAEAIDYRTIEMVLADEFSLCLNSEWMTRIEKTIAERAHERESEPTTE